MLINGRTDLAVEAHKLWNSSSEENTQLKGVKARRQVIGDIEVNSIDILNAEGAKALSKPIGKYFSIDINSRFERGAEIFSDAAAAVSHLLSTLISGRGYTSFLIAALGNPDITPDAVGSVAAANIIVTRHLKSSMPEDFSSFSDTMLCRTGVLGTTGIESASQIKCICDDFKPDCVIVIDALAGSDLKRLCRCIQICDSGISPGSGVGNNRSELSEKSLGVPVIAVGVPTVIDASAFSDNEELKSMFVTPRDIDSSVRSISKLLAYGVNLALHPGLTVEDIDMLVG